MPDRDEPTGPAVVGTVDPAFAEVADVLDRNVQSRGETSADLCVYFRGECVVDLTAGGRPPDGVQVIRSIGKAVLALLVHVLAERSVVDPNAPVIRWWPEFAAAGKDGILLRWVLSHQSGLPRIEQRLDPLDGLRWTPAVRALEAQQPSWPPGTAHGYHDLSFGWLVGEVLQRATGRTVGALVHDLLAKPLGLDLWCGLPLRSMRRVVHIAPAGSPSGLNATRRSDDRSVRRIVDAARNPDFVGWEHRPEYLAASVPATNMVSNARALARLFAATVGDVDGVRVVGDDTVRAMTAERAAGPDETVGWDRRYSDGFMLPDPTRPMAGLDTRSFGHYAQGGSLAFAEPSSDVALAYLTAREQIHLGADPRTSEIARVVRSCAEWAR